MVTSPLIIAATFTGADTVDPTALAGRLRRAEQLGLGLVLFDDAADAPAGGTWQPDPIEVAAHAAALTSTLGLVATAATTHAEPYHLSNRLSSLDWGSDGRAGWLATVDTGQARARAYSAPTPGAAAARREGDEVLDAVRALWDSWQDGALIADTATGRFLDHTRLHYVDAGTEFFHIRGPALMPRPPQGNPLVFGLVGQGLAGTDLTVGDEPAGVDLVRLSHAGADELLPAILALRGRAAGVLLHGAGADQLLDALAAVLPGLLDAGVAVRPRPGQTLRDRFGLPRPSGRYVAGNHNTDRTGARA